jgi:hypothetical protein
MRCEGGFTMLNGNFRRKLESKRRKAYKGSSVWFHTTVCPSLCTLLVFFVFFSFFVVAWWAIVTKYSLFPPKMVLIWGRLSARRTRKEIRSLSMPARVAIQVRTSDFNTASLRFGDLRLYLSTVHGRFRPNIEQDDLTHLIPRCPAVERSAGLESKSVSGNMRLKRDLLTS